jgi:transitional endoplasmic reticulum ATPase
MRNSKQSSFDRELVGDDDTLVRLWALRILVPLGGHNKFIRKHGFSSDALASYIGLRHWLDSDSEKFSADSVSKELRKLYQAGEALLAGTQDPSCLWVNITRLKELVGLSSAETKILEFVVLLHHEEVMGLASDLLGSLSTTKQTHVLSLVLGLPQKVIRAALASNSVLCKSGLVSIDNYCPSQILRHKLCALSHDFAEKVCSSEEDPFKLLHSVVSVSSPAELGFDDYQHIKNDLKILKPFLTNAQSTGRVGVNIFIHGAPGTGKNQLAKVLAEEAGCKLFEVASENEEGEPLIGKARLRAFGAAQSFFAKKNSIILFDEAEDVFGNGDMLFDIRSAAQSVKAWVNRTLEENPIPTIWLSNSVRGLDPAFIRRFDLIINLPIPPKKQRAAILEDACGDFVNKEVIKRLSESENLSPGVVMRAASVARLVNDDSDAGAISSSAIETIINNTLETQGHKPVRANDPNRLPPIYSAAYIQADTQVLEVAAGLAQSKAGRLCLYGPSGTGKTAYGRWLAEELDLPLLTKKASDLMSKYVGENEANIACAFKQAEQEGAILLIDEVDSFLRERAGASSSWEISLVNEMLTQMEAFSGIFIASTNLMEGMDKASLRRFDLKIKFDYLHADQAWALFKQYCKMLKITRPQFVLRKSLDSMNCLTPGDYAAVARRHRFHQIRSASQMIDALQAECSVKHLQSRRVGFIQH